MFTNIVSLRSVKVLVDSPENGTKINKLTLFQNLIYLHQYDIVCVCETWLNDLVLDNEILPGYTIYRKDRRGNMRGGGVLIAVRNELRFSRKFLLEGEQSEHFMIELYPANCTKFMLGVFSYGQKTVMDTNTPPWIDREVRHLINKNYTALRRYRQKWTEERKHKLRKLTQETENLIKLK